MDLHTGTRCANRPSANIQQLVALFGKDYENTIWIGLEYFCTEGDDFWKMSDKDFTQMAIGELTQIGIIDPDDVLDSVRIKVKKPTPLISAAITNSIR